jgi:hypothetical protein
MIKAFAHDRQVTELIESENHSFEVTVLVVAIDPKGGIFPIIGDRRITRLDCGRGALMLDNPEKTARLLAALKAAVPFKRDFANEDVFSSRMMSMHNSTHSSQINTVGPAMSLRTSCWLLPQNEQ